VQQEVGYNQKQLQSIPQKRSKKAELNYDIGSRYLQQNQPQKAIEYFNNTVELTKAEESYPAFEAPKDFEPARLDTDGLAEIDSIITPGPRLEEETEDESELDDEESIVVGETNPGTTPGPEQPSNTVDRPAFKEEIEPIMPSPEKSAKKVAFDSLLELRSATYRKLAEAYALDKNYLKAWEFGQKALQEADSARKQEVQLLQSAASNREALALREQRIITLEQDRKLQAEQLRSQRLLNFGLGALLIAIVLGGLLLWRIQRKRRRASQLLTLRSLVGQMNPHFIFNSLNTFNSYIATADTQRANRFLGDFSRLIRQVLEYSGHDFVTLSRELEILGLYLKLEHGRFEEHFDYELNISPELDLDAIQIPPMLLQPYVENAIWHGLRYREDKGMLHINMFSNNHKTYIVITDNGIGRSKSHELKTHNQQQRSNSLGMKNTARRAALVQSLLKKRLQIHVSDLATDPNYPGTRVELVISD
jgi:tetratricopeptide (TPR) repeat protein